MWHLAAKAAHAKAEPFLREVGWRDYAANLHPKMIGLTGSEDQVKAASQTYKTYFKKQDAADQFYLVDHSTFTYLVLPKVGFVEFFKREDSADAMAKRVSCFIENTPE